MTPDNEQIISLLNDAQNYHKRLLRDLIDAGALPHTLRAVIEAMSSIGSAINDPFEPHYAVRAQAGFTITDEIAASVSKLNHLLEEAVEMEKQKLPDPKNVAAK